MNLATIPHWSQFQSPWTPPHIEQTLEMELGERAWSWAHDVNPYEHHPLADVLAMVPGANPESAIELGEIWQ